ncbi:MAG: hypothetical protein WCN98_13040, partial [Verrucomicrobiaceae bacterium]
AMRAIVRTSGPRLQISKMTPRPIDLGIMGDSEDDDTDGSKLAILRYPVLLLIIIGVLWYVYRLTS